MPSKVIKACANKRQKLSCGSENVVVVGKVSTKKPSSQEDDGNGELIKNIIIALAVLQTKGNTISKSIRRSVGYIHCMPSYRMSSISSNSCLKRCIL
jgi:hypothetical protein